MDSYMDGESDCEDEEVIEECETDFEEDEFEEIVPLKDDSKFILKGHTNVVLSVTCDTKNEFIFTGSMDDSIIVWNISTGSQVCTLTGHSDSVTHLSLDKSGSFLISGDLQGLVIVWKISRNPTKIENFKFLEVSEVIDIKWNFSSQSNEEYLYICDKTGTVQSFSYETISDETSCELNPTFYSQGKGCSCNGFNIILDGKYVSVLYGGTCGDHEECSNTNELFLCNLQTYATVKVDLKSVANEEEDNDEGLGAGFATMKLNNSEMVAIGDWSQLILASLVDVGHNVNYKLLKVPIKDGGLVTNIAFSDVLPYIAFASKYGVIGVYDVSHNRIRHMWNYSSTITSNINQDIGDEQLTVSQLKWYPGKPNFFTTGLDGRLCLWDGRLSPNGDVPSWWGHSGIIWDLCVTNNGKSIVTVSEDRTGRLFEI